MDNPAYGWFGLSSTARVRFRAGPARAISVAEVVVAADADAEITAAVRELMVALARAGVTATCSVAGAPRYGDLSVDSNLPDARISVGDERLHGNGSRRSARQVPRWSGFRPRRRCATSGCPARTCATLPRCPSWWSAPTATPPPRSPRSSTTSPTVRSPSTRTWPRGDFEHRTVALINRGMPGFAVDTDGTLHMSLMRSCTGWPSGTWIDPPRRTAPDGSNFGLQHWTHSFDYAIVAGDGDWRDNALPTRSAEFNNRLLAVTARHGNAGGGLPSWGSLLEVQPAGAVALGALKVAGNPTARGSAHHADPADGVAIRLVETLGRTAEVTLQSGLRHVTAAAAARPDRSAPRRRRPTTGACTGTRSTTLHTRLNLPRVLDAVGQALGPDAEPAQPLYARYWLHNRGPAPLGGLPAVAHLHPHRLDVRPADKVTLRLTAASDATDVAVHGRVRVLAPPGWTVGTTELPFVLPPGEYLESTVEVDVPPGAAPGLYPVRAELAATGAAIPARRGIRPSRTSACCRWGGTTTSCCGCSRVRRRSTVAAGEQARISVTVATDAHADLALEAHLVSPWGTWEWLGPNIVGDVVPARGSVTLTFDAAPPVWTTPGRWWALLRVACAGALVYTPAVSVEVTR